MGGRREGEEREKRKGEEDKEGKGRMVNREG